MGSSFEFEVVRVNEVSNMTNTVKCENVCSAEWLKTARGEREEEIDRCVVGIENVNSCALLPGDLSLGSSFGEDKACEELSNMTNTVKSELVVCEAEWMKTGRVLKGECAVSEADV